MMPAHYLAGGLLGGGVLLALMLTSGVATETGASGEQPGASVPECDYGVEAGARVTGTPGDAYGGMTGYGGMGGLGGATGRSVAAGPGRQSSSIPRPSTELARAIQRTLDENFESVEAVQLEVHELDSWFMSELQIPLFLDQPSLELAEVDESVKIDVDVSAMPLRSALRQTLGPLGLKAVVEDEGLVVVADHTVLARRGIQTDRWLDVTPEMQARFEEVMSQKVSFNFPEIPLDDAVRAMSEEVAFPIVLDRVALDKVGLTTGIPVSGVFQEISLRSALKRLVREIELTYTLRDEALLITSVDAAESMLRTRIYWLEGTGVPRGDLQEITESIMTAIEPETWEWIGGPSSISRLQSGGGNRPSLLISTTDEVHEQIESLFDALRQAHTGPDPISQSSSATAPAPPQGSGGMGGFGGGAMGGGGMF